MYIYIYIYIYREREKRNLAKAKAREKPSRPPGNPLEQCTTNIYIYIYI